METPRNAPPGPLLLWPTHTVSQATATQFEFAVPNTLEADVPWPAVTRFTEKSTPETLSCA
jgi:hypothetical protein